MLLIDVEEEFKDEFAVEGEGEGTYPEDDVRASLFFGGRLDDIVGSTKERIGPSKEEDN